MSNYNRNFWGAKTIEVGSKLLDFKISSAACSRPIIQYQLTELSKNIKMLARSSKHNEINSRHKQVKTVYDKLLNICVFLFTTKEINHLQANHLRRIQYKIK